MATRVLNPSVALSKQHTELPEARSPCGRVALWPSQQPAHGWQHAIMLGIQSPSLMRNVSTGHAKLADFGAAFYYGPSSPHASDYQAMDVRAFGLLLQDRLFKPARGLASHRCVSDAMVHTFAQELLDRHDGSGPAEKVSRLQSVARACTGQAKQRPTFTKVLHLLSILQPTAQS